MFALDRKPTLADGSFRPLPVSGRYISIYRFMDTQHPSAAK
jgi:hypothetical protein